MSMHPEKEEDSRMASSSTTNVEILVVPRFSTEGLVFGLVLLVLGIIVWQFKHVRGIGDGLIAISIFIFTFNGLKFLQDRIMYGKGPFAQLIMNQVRRLTRWQTARRAKRS